MAKTCRRALSKSLQEIQSQTRMAWVVKFPAAQIAQIYAIVVLSVGHHPTLMLACADCLLVLVLGPKKMMLLMCMMSKLSILFLWSRNNRRESAPPVCSTNLSRACPVAFGETRTP